MLLRSSQEIRKSKAMLLVVVVLLLALTLTLVCAVVYILMSCKYMFIDNTAWSKGESIIEETEMLNNLLANETFNWLVAEEWLGVVPVCTSLTLRKLEFHLITNNHSPSCWSAASCQWLHRYLEGVGNVAKPWICKNRIWNASGIKYQWVLQRLVFA